MICIYHSADLDGYCSGAIVKKKYPDCKLIGYNYGQDIPWNEIPEGEPVIMVDVSFGMVEMHELAVRNPLIWIDHHISQVRSLAQYENTVEDLIPFKERIFKDGIAACELTWEYLFPFADGYHKPIAVTLLGMYDTWRQNDPKINWEYDILPFQYGMRLGTKSSETFPMYLLDGDAGVSIGDFKLKGFTILEYQKQQDERAMQGAFECDLAGYPAIACNIRGGGSLVFESVYDPTRHALMIGFGFNGKGLWTFSLRSDKTEVDCSAIAKQFGGGGHKGAAGFSSNSLEAIINLPLKEDKA